jgi:hypothetical protein
MNLAEVRLLADFRFRYRGLSWDQLGQLFGCTGVEAREQWLIHTEWHPDLPDWWRAARDLWGEGWGVRRIGHALGKDKMAVKYALRRMEIAA